MQSQSNRIARAKELEAIIDANRDAFMATGSALVEIRDARLYLRGHDSFGAWLEAEYPGQVQEMYDLISTYEEVVRAAG